MTQMQVHNDYVFDFIDISSVERVPYKSIFFWQINT